MVEVLSINHLEELINFTSCGPFKYLQHVSLMCMILVSKEPLFHLWPVSFCVALCKFFFFFFPLGPHIIFIFPKDINFLDTTEIIYSFPYKKRTLSSYYPIPPKQTLLSRSLFQLDKLCMKEMYYFQSINARNSIGFPLSICQTENLWNTNCQILEIFITVGAG